jgi:RNA polymerase sigma-70 factor, ECF subfamily
MSSGLTNSGILPVLRATSAVDSRNRGAALADRVTALFDQFRNPLLRYLWSFGLTPPDGEEVLQEVFLSLFQHLDRGRSLDNPRGWLFRVAHNLALRTRSRCRRDSEARDDACVENLAIHSAPNPEDQLADSQTQQCLLAVVEALPEQDRRCLLLRAEGLRYREIAGILDMSLGAVSLSLARSLARIARSAEGRRL